MSRLHFTEEMTKEDVEKKYEEILAEKGAEECKAIIADLPGGTPYNAAMRIVSEHKNIQLVAGLSQQLLVLINSGEELADAIEQVGEIYGNTKVAKENKTVQAPKEPVEKNGIVNFRLDERLIHGQVATFWTRTLQADRIIVADDDVLKDEIGVSALKAAVPSGVHLSILSVDNAAARLKCGDLQRTESISHCKQDKNDPQDGGKRTESKRSEHRKHGRKRGQTADQKIRNTAHRRTGGR